MSRDNMELVLVRKNGPIQSMKFRVWWIYFLFMILVALFMGLGATTYLLYRQHQAIRILAEDSQLMLLRTERLESLVQDQEISQILAQQKAEQALASAEAAAKPAKPAQMAAKPAAPPEKSLPPKEKPEDKPKAEPASAEKPDNNAESQPPEQPKAEKTEVKPAAAEKREAPSTLIEPTASDVVGIKDIVIEQKDGKLLLRYKVSNAKAPEGKAMGYTTVIARGVRAGKPWIEASPPMRLSPLGRPLNYKRGVPFSVQYHRPIKASFSLNDKHIERLELLVHSRDGDVLLLKNKDLKENGAKQNNPGNN